MDTVRIAIIGIGNIGSAHSSCIASGKIKGLSLVALCDNNHERLDFFKQMYPECRCFLEYKELIDSNIADAVIIAVPHPYHAQIAEYAFEHGMHVLLEKPVDICISSARKLNEIAERSGKIFGIMFNQRTNTLFAKIREIVHQGTLGTPRRLIWTVTNWYRTQRYYDSGEWRGTWKGEGGGVLINQAPHNLDLWQWIFGMPKRLRAFCYEGKYHHIEVEDDVTIYGEYDNGATAIFIASTGEYPGSNRLEITGDCGKLVAENGKLTLWTLSESERNYCFDMEAKVPPQITSKVFEFSNSEHEHQNILKNFADAVLYGTQLISPGYDGIYELTLSNAAYLSSWTDSWIDIPFDECIFDETLEKKISTSSFKPLNGKQLNLPHNEYNKRWVTHW